MNRISAVKFDSNNLERQFNSLMKKQILKKMAFIRF